MLVNVSSYASTGIPKYNIQKRDYISTVKFGGVVTYIDTEKQLIARLFCNNAVPSNGTLNHIKQFLSQNAGTVLFQNIQAELNLFSYCTSQLANHTRQFY